MPEFPLAPIHSRPQWVAAGASFTAGKLAGLFGNDSPLLADNPYALSAPQNTQRARRSDWKAFLNFCDSRHYPPLPAAPAIVVAFLEAMSHVGSGLKSVATLQRYLSTLALAHTLAGHPDPTRSTLVRDALKALTRGRPRSQPRQALRWESISTALQMLDTGAKAWDLRAKAMLAVAYSTMARRAELVALRVEDLSLDPGPDATALIYMSKVDRQEARYLSVDAVTHLSAWLQHTQITAGKVFRRLERTGVVGERSLHPQEVGRTFERIGQHLREKGLSWPSLRLGAHSTRIGAAHDMVAAGIDLTSIMHSGGWHDPKMPRYYTRELATRDSGMARMLRARNR